MPEATLPDPDDAAEGSGTTGRTRLRDALLRPSRSQVVVGVLLAVVGFAGIVQVRTIAADDTYSGYREQDLIDLLSGIAGTTQRAEAEIARLEQTRDDLRSTTTGRTTALEQAQREARTLAVLAGTVAVEGPGLRVTLTDDDGTIDPAHVVDMLQELRTAGAEAIEVNDEVRVVVDTFVGTGGDGLAVDGVRLSSPYVVDVIGAPDTLAGAMSFPDGPTERFRGKGVDVEVEELDSVEVTSVVELDTPSFADPAG
ncbi:DUF881 domain-containing protein [Nocardioides sp. CPCC 205120]|uniref:DUF881 domain-containing protein n=1 Tax=Nocardioides sp. CPCC 205120 TaxID=3406462 RepID=UPI003B505C2E